MISGAPLGPLTPEHFKPFHLEHPNKKNNESLTGVTTLDDLRDAGKIKDSGMRRVFESGAHRDSDASKPRLDLLPLTALIRVSHHYAAGAKKYGDNNWRKGMPRQEFLKSAFRHLVYLMLGRTDEDHAAALAWNVLGFIETEELNLDAPDARGNAS